MPENLTKGIILAAGQGSRLYPLTTSISKQLLPVYDKPMIYYPLAVLMSMDIKDILIISNQRDEERYRDLFGDGSSLGINLKVTVQTTPRGIPDAFVIGADFIDGGSVVLILGDNIFYPADKIIKAAKKYDGGAMVFGYRVEHPEKYGVAVTNNQLEVIDIVEKPTDPPSDIAVTGLYIFDKHAVDIAPDLVPSDRGELEITDIMRSYIKKKKLQLHNLYGERATWFDCGMADDLQKASISIKENENFSNKKIGCIEEIAYRKGFITAEKLFDMVKKLPKNEYRRYLEKVLKDKKS